MPRSRRSPLDSERTRTRSWRRTRPTWPTRRVPRGPGRAGGGAPRAAAARREKLAGMDRRRPLGGAAGGPGRPRPLSDAPRRRPRPREGLLPARRPCGRLRGTSRCRDADLGARHQVGERRDPEGGPRGGAEHGGARRHDPGGAGGSGTPGRRRPVDPRPRIGRRPPRPRRPRRPRHSARFERAREVDPGADADSRPRARRRGLPRLRRRGGGPGRWRSPSSSTPS